MRVRPSLTFITGIAVLAVGPIGVAAAAGAAANPATPAARPSVTRTVNKVFLIGAAKAPATPSLAVRAAQEVPTSVAPPPPPDPNDPDDYVDPLAEGHVISPFGWRSGRRHEGTDFKGPMHAAVLAPFAGTVIQAGPGLTGYGNTVMIDFGQGVTTRLAHLASWSVERGEHVAQGQVVGVQGMTGSASTPHVHYEIRVDGVPRDSGPYLSGE
jgi:murein DD-endopeptidase MepM/ murein hydrolase activator NlpD